MGEAGAATYESLINLQTPRTDCPTTLPVPPGAEEAWKAYVRAQRTPETPDSIAEMISRRPDLFNDQTPITDLHRIILHVANSITGGDTTDQAAGIETTWDGALYVRSQMQRFLARLKEEADLQP